MGIDVELNDREETVECTGCEAQPELFYDPTTDAPFRLRCECDVTVVDVTDCLERTKLVELTGKWSNFDKDSTMYYGES